MFSGIVETTSPILKIESIDGQQRVRIRRPSGWNLIPGESVSVDGVCSTVERRTERAFDVIYMPETLRRTTLGDLIPGSAVNLERCLTLRSLIGGHVVQGHVDATARITALSADGGAAIYEFAPPRRLMRYVVEKGSVALDGISLTVVHAGRDRFTVSLLKRTLSHTTMGGKRRGDRVNVEVDLLAKYAERLLAR